MTRAPKKKTERKEERNGKGKSTFASYLPTFFSVSSKIFLFFFSFVIFHRPTFSSVLRWTEKKIHWKNEDPKLKHTRNVFTFEICNLESPANEWNVHSPIKRAAGWAAASRRIHSMAKWAILAASVLHFVKCNLWCFYSLLCVYVMWILSPLLSPIIYLLHEYHIYTERSGTLLLLMSKERKVDMDREGER